MTERILGAAIKLSQGTVYSSGIGHMRHGDILHEMMGGASVPVADRLSAEQGFMTSELRFVDRVEARKIAVAAGQIEDCNCLHAQELFTEDLW